MDRGTKRPREHHDDVDPAILRERAQWTRRSMNKDLNLAADILADIGVCPLEDDDNDSSDAENEAPVCNSSALDLTSFWDSDALGPTPPNNIIPNSAMPLRMNQAQNTGTPALVEKGSFRLRKRPRTDKPTIVQPDFFSEISDEMFLQIFQWLPKTSLTHCAKVCKRWRRLSYDESLWKFLDLAGRKLSITTLVDILERGVVIMRLAKAEIGAPILFDQITDNNRSFKVHYLDLSMAAINVSELEVLLGQCKCLQKLSLENCQLNEEICKYLSENKNLVELNMCMCSGIDKRGLQMILNGCKKLESLNLAWTELSSDCVFYAVCNFPTSLKHLNLSGCRQTIDNNDIDDLTDTCPNLETLDLSDALKLTVACIKVIFRSLTNLSILNLSRCFNIHPESYKALAESSSLTELNVFGIFTPPGIGVLKECLERVSINASPLSTVARPTTGIRRTSIWTLRVRE